MGAIAETTCNTYTTCFQQNKVETTAGSTTAEPVCGECLQGYTLVSGDCVQCGSGTYKSFSGNGACTNCPVNTYSTTVGATAIDTCQDCYEYSTSLEGSDALSDCDCDDGYTLSNGACAVDECPPGKTGEPGSCTNCPANTYKSSSGNGACTPYTTCFQQNKVETTAGSTTAEPVCGECLQGYTLVSGDCVQCVSGTYKSFSGNGACTPCADGKYSNAVGAIAETTCNTYTTCALLNKVETTAGSTTTEPVCGDCLEGYREEGDNCVDDTCLPGFFSINGGCACCGAGKFFSQEKKICESYDTCEEECELKIEAGGGENCFPPDQGNSNPYIKYNGICGSEPSTTDDYCEKAINGVFYIDTERSMRLSSGAANMADLFIGEVVEFEYPDADAEATPAEAYQHPGNQKWDDFLNEIPEDDALRLLEGTKDALEDVCANRQPPYICNNYPHSQLLDAQTDGRRCQMYSRDKNICGASCPQKTTADSYENAQAGNVDAAHFRCSKFKCGNKYKPQLGPNKNDCKLNPDDDSDTVGLCEYGTVLRVASNRKITRCWCDPPEGKTCDDFDYTGKPAIIDNSTANKLMDGGTESLPRVNYWDYNRPWGAEEWPPPT